ncbi:MAG: protein kinase domain-containing protein [Candidatus Xenobia bacterium]
MNGSELLAGLAVTLSPWHLSESLEAAATRLREGLEADSIAIYLANPAGTELTLATCSPADRDEPLQLVPGAGVLGRAARTAGAINVQSTDDPQQIGRYRIVDSLSNGLHRVAWDEDGCRRQAALQMLPGLELDREARERLSREIEMASRIDHPNVCRLLDWGYGDNKTPYLIVELLEGGPLLEMVPQPRELGLAPALDMMRQALQGLAAVHESGLVHRDIQASRLFCTWTGTVKLFDLGFARRFAPHANPSALGIDEVTCLSPEQLFNGVPVDRRSDLFSLGAVFYQMLSGHLPFEGEHLGQVLTRIAQSEATPLREWRSDVPSEVAQFIHRLLSASPDARPASARAALAELPQ